MEENNFNQNPNNLSENPRENNPQSVYEREVPQINEKQTKSVGAIIGIVIIIVIIIFGGLYYWGAQISNQKTQSDQQGTTPTPEEIGNKPDAALEQLQTQNASDEVADIETDLNATDLDGLDAELKQIDSEFTI